MGTPCSRITFGVVEKLGVFMLSETTLADQFVVFIHPADRETGVYHSLQVLVGVLHEAQNTVTNSWSDIRQKRYDRVLLVTFIEG